MKPIRKYGFSQERKTLYFSWMEEKFEKNVDSFLAQRCVFLDGRNSREERKMTQD